MKLWNAITLFACLFLPLGLEADGIGICFGGDRSIWPALTEWAGVPRFQQENWNLATGPNGELLELRNEKGSRTTAHATWQSDGQWHDVRSAPRNSNERLMYGFLVSKDPAPDQVRRPAIMVCDIPYSTYDVLVYLNGGTFASTATIKIEGRSFDVQLGPETFRKFRQANSQTKPARGSFVRFKNLTAVTFTAYVTTNKGSIVYAEAGISAIQIVDMTVHAPEAPSGIAISPNTILDTLRPGASLGELAASDPNLEDSHTFALASGPGAQDNSVCKIDGSRLVLRRALAGRANSTLQIRVRATDSTSRRFEQSIALPILAAAASGIHPVISEFLADNDDGLRDSDGDASDWIEIHNPHTAPIHLAGYGLSDRAGFAWMFPDDAVISPDERIVIFASGKDRRDFANELHTSFRLKARGTDDERHVMLLGPGGAMVSDLVYPVQHSNVSYSVPANGVGTFHVPTPGGPEGPAASGVTAKPILVGNARVGFGGINVTFENPVDAATVHFTLDGTVPTDASPTFTGNPIQLTQSAVLTARAFKSGMLPGPVLSTAFAVVDPSLMGRTTKTPLVIIDTLGQSLLENGGGIGEQARAGVDAVAIVLNGAPEYVTLDGSPDYAGIAHVKVRGVSSASFPKLSYTLELRDVDGSDRDAELLGMPAESDWVLNSGYLDYTLNNAIGFKCWEAMGRYAPRTRSAEVYFNTDGIVDSADYAGLYTLMETIKKGAKRVNPRAGDPILFKVDRLSHGSPSLMCIDREPEEFDRHIVTQATDNGSPTDPLYSGVSLSKKSSEEDRLAVQSLFSRFETSISAPTFRDPIRGYAQFIDSSSWIDMHLLQDSFLKNVDAFRFSHYGFVAGGKIHLGPPWDFDRSMGVFADPVIPSTNPEGYVHDHLVGPQYAWYPNLIGKSGFTGNYDIDFRQRWMDRLHELLTGPLSVDSICGAGGIFDQVASEREDAIIREIRRWPPVGLNGVTATDREVHQVFTDRVNALKQFMSARAAWLKGELIEPPSISPSGGTSQIGTRIGFSAPVGIVFYTVDGNDPRKSGGKPSRSARFYLPGRGPSLKGNTVVTARARLGAFWSAPVVARFYTNALPANFSNIGVSEIHYHPSEPSASERRILGEGITDADFEFIEIRNTSASPVELGGVHFEATKPFDAYSFGQRVLTPGEVVVVVKNRRAFEQRHGRISAVAGEWGSGNLNNGGERVILLAADGSTIADFAYDDDPASGWPVEADGAGKSLLLLSPDGTAIKAASPEPDGNPGE